jgi:hypothetical protein
VGITGRLFLGILAGAAVAAASASDAAARPRKKKPRYDVAAFEILSSPDVIDGRAIVARFTLFGKASRPARLEFDYGTDRNADGAIADDEFRPALLDLLDPSNTYDIDAKNRIVWPADPAGGRVHEIAWDARGALGAVRVPAHALAGFSSSAPAALTAAPEGARGIVLRARVKKKVVGTSEEFSIDGDDAPEASIESVGSGELREIAYTAFDRESEDLDGDGEWDQAEGEDLNGDGLPQFSSVTPQFWYAPLEDGQDPGTMDEQALFALHWYPCTPQDPVTQVAANQTGISHTFSWDAGADGFAISNDTVVGVIVVDEQAKPSRFRILRTRVPAGL